MEAIVRLAATHPYVGSNEEETVIEVGAAEAKNEQRIAEKLVGRVIEVEWHGAYFDAKVTGVTFPEQDAKTSKTSKTTLSILWLRDGSISQRVSLTRIKRSNLPADWPPMSPGGTLSSSVASPVKASEIREFGKGIKDRRADDHVLRGDGVKYDDGVETPSAADVVRNVRDKLMGRMDKLMMNHLLPGCKSAVWETIQKDEYRKHRLYRKSVDLYLDGHIVPLRTIFERFTITGDGIFEKAQKQQEELKKKKKNEALRKEMKKRQKKLAADKPKVEKDSSGSVSRTGLTSLIEATRSGMGKQELELESENEELTRAEEREEQKDFLKSVGSFYGPKGQTTKMQQAMLFRELAPHEQSLLQSLPASASRPIIALGELCGVGVVRAAANVAATRAKSRLVRLGVEVDSNASVGGGGGGRKKKRHKRRGNKRTAKDPNETTIVIEADEADGEEEEEGADKKGAEGLSDVEDDSDEDDISESKTSSKRPPLSAADRSKTLIPGARCHVKAISFTTNSAAEEVLESGAPPLTFPSPLMTNVSCSLEDYGFERFLPAAGGNAEGADSSTTLTGSQIARGKSSTTITSTAPSNRWLSGGSLSEGASCARALLKRIRAAGGVHAGEREFESVAAEAARVVEAARKEAKMLVQWKQEGEHGEEKKAKEEWEKAHRGKVQVLEEVQSPVQNRSAFGGGRKNEEKDEKRRCSAVNMLFVLKASARDTRNEKVDVMSHKQLVVQQIRNKMAAKVEIKMGQLAERARLSKLKRKFGWAAKRECRITLQQWLALLSEASLLRSGKEPGHMQELVGHGHSHNHARAHTKPQPVAQDTRRASVSNMVFAAAASANDSFNASISVGSSNAGEVNTRPGNHPDFRNSWSVSLQEASHVFAVSKLMTIDEEASPDGSSLNFVDFLEAICRLADLLSLPNSVGHQVEACRRKCREAKRARADAALAKQRWLEEQAKDKEAEAKQKAEVLIIAREKATKSRGQMLERMQEESKQWFTEEEAARDNEKQQELENAISSDKVALPNSIAPVAISMFKSIGNGAMSVSPANIDLSRAVSPTLMPALSGLSVAAGKIADSAGLVDPLRLQQEMIQLSSGRSVAKAQSAQEATARSWKQKMDSVSAEVADLNEIMHEAKKGKIAALPLAKGNKGKRKKAGVVGTGFAFAQRQKEELKKLVSMISVLQRKMSTMKNQADMEAKLHDKLVVEQEHARDAAHKWVEYRMEEERQFIKKRRADYAKGGHAPVVAGSDVDARLKTATNLQAIEVISTILHLQRSFRRRKQERVNAQAEERSRSQPILQSDGTFVKTAIIVRKALNAFNKLTNHSKTSPSPSPTAGATAANPTRSYSPQNRGSFDVQAERKLSVGGNEAVLEQSLGQTGGEPAIGSGGGQIVTVICPPGPLGLLLVETGTGLPEWNAAPRRGWQPSYVRLEGFSSEIAKVEFTRAQVAMLAAAIPLRSYLLTVDRVDVHKSSPESVLEYLHYKAAEPRTLRFEMPVERGGVDYWKPPEEMRQAIMADMSGKTDEDNRVAEIARRAKSNAGRRRALLRSVMAKDSGTDDGDQEEEDELGDAEAEHFKVGGKLRKDKTVGAWMKASTGLKKEALMDKANKTKAAQEAESKRAEEEEEEARKCAGYTEWWEERRPPLAVFDAEIERELEEEEKEEERKWKRENGVAEAVASKSVIRTKAAKILNSRVAGPGLVRYEEAQEEAEGKRMGQAWQQEELDEMGVFKLVVSLSRDPRVKSHANGRWAACDAAYMAYQAALAALEQAQRAEKSLLYIQLTGAQDEWSADGKQRRPYSPTNRDGMLMGMGGVVDRPSPGRRTDRTHTHSQHRFFGAADSRNDYTDDYSTGNARIARAPPSIPVETTETISYAPSSKGKPPLAELLRRLLPLLYARLAVEPETSPALKAAIPGRNARREYLRKGPIHGLRVCMYGKHEAEVDTDDSDAGDD
jgi:hypothetical protein